MNTLRIIGERSGSMRGPLFFIFAQIHGNEPAGYQAVLEFFNAVDDEYRKNPSFDFRGKIVALQGNYQAAQQGIRFLKRDLNRSWTTAQIEYACHTDPQLLDAEDLELRQTMDIIRHHVEDYQPQQIVFLDLHTTSAQGGVFIIPAPNEWSRQIALQMHAPVLHGFLDRLQGTTLHYFNTQNMNGIETASICFEAGQHLNPRSVNHSVAAIISCFTAAGGFFPEDIESKHEQLLLQDSHGLPREGNLVYVHAIRPDDQFYMRHDKIFTNFQPIHQDELLAFDQSGEIRAPLSGFILMPLYQKQGSDGFFIIQSQPRAGLISALPQPRTQFVH